MDSANILLTEIALDLLGNKFYDLNGERVYSLDALYQLQNTKAAKEENKDKKNLLGVLEITEADLQATDLKQEIITLDDDDDEVDFQKKEGLAASGHEFIHSGRNSLNTEQNNKYNSINKDDRLLFIQTNSKLELVDMRINSSLEKRRYLKDNNLLDDSGIHIASEESLNPFFSKEKSALVAESGSLMDFIKVIRNDGTNSKDILRRVASDILLAKDIIC